MRIMLLHCKLHWFLAVCESMRCVLKPVCHLHVQISLEGINQLDTKVWLGAVLLEQVRFLQPDHMVSETG